MAEHIGVNTQDVIKIHHHLENLNKRVVFIFDGIEDLFEDTDDENSKSAISSLLRINNLIREILSPFLGSIVFVRADYAQASIKQNFGQWMQRFQSFRLQWNPESFLRLAYMLAQEAGIYDRKVAVESLYLDDLKTKLQSLWGKKLGSEKSKEAHSARWVYTALCDLKGNVQARDLVRFLKFAAEQEVRRNGPNWSDRILSPDSMRNAIPQCSEEKIEEAEKEIKPLQRWKNLLNEREVSYRKIPFSPEQVFLDNTLLNALIEVGVIYEDTDRNEENERRLFLPEIYKYGLGFETSASGRPRMQALLKKNIGTIPL